MRYYIIEREPGFEPWVLAEVVDPDFARDQVMLCSDSAVLSEEEAELDPEFHDAVEDWKARDDSRYSRWDSELQADIRLDAIIDEAVADGSLPRPTEEELIQQMLKERENLPARQPRPEPDASILAAYEQVGMELVGRYLELKRTFSEDAATRLARRVAVDAIAFVRSAGQRLV